MNQHTKDVYVVPLIIAVVVGTVAAPHTRSSQRRWIAIKWEEKWAAEHKFYEQEPDPPTGIWRSFLRIFLRFWLK